MKCWINSPPPRHPQWPTDSALVSRWSAGQLQANGSCLATPPHRRLPCPSSPVPLACCPSPEDLTNDSQPSRQGELSCLSAGLCNLCWVVKISLADLSESTLATCGFLARYTYLKLTFIFTLKFSEATIINYFTNLISEIYFRNKLLWHVRKLSFLQCLKNLYVPCWAVGCAWPQMCISVCICVREHLWALQVRVFVWPVLMIYT